MDQVKEIFKDIPGYEGHYQISNYGRVKSLKSGKRFGKILIPQMNEKGYLKIPLSNGITKKTCKIHRLVALTFLPIPTKDKTTVNHKNWNKLDNYINNLEWATHQENIDHAKKNKLFNNPHSENSHNAKLKNEEVFELKNLYISGLYSQRALARKYGVHPSTIYLILKNKSWQKLKI
jgi:hypothetical protein